MAAASLLAKFFQDSPPWFRYLLGIALPAAAFLIQMGMAMLLGHQSPLMLFLLSVSMVAFFGGQGPGLLSTGLSVLVVLYAILFPTHLPIQLNASDQFTRLVIFTLTGTSISFMAGSLHRARDQQRILADQLARDTAALREQEQLLRSITDNSRDIILVKDLEGRIVFMNRMGREAVGRPWNQIIGKTDAELHPHADQVARFRTSDLQVVRERQTLTLDDAYNIPATGEWRTALTTKTPRFDEKGEVIGVVAVIHDTTEQRSSEVALRASEERLRLAAEAGGFGTYVRDLVSGQVWWSDELREIAGLQPGQPIPDDFLYLHVHPEDVERVVAARTHWFSPQGPDSYEDEHRWKLPDGTVRWVFLKGSTIFESEGESRRAVRAMGAVIDITSRKEAEVALQESKLAAESARVSAEHARELAEAASRAKDDFLAALSHELRNPLNPVLLVASEWERDPAITPEIRADWALVRRNISLEARLIDDLLDLTSIARGKVAVNVAATDVHEVLREALETVRGELEHKGLTLHLDFDGTHPSIQADAVRLQQVFWNVLKNAVKFTPSGGLITVRTRTELQEQRVTIEISDSGIGMRPEELARVFDAFSQGDHAAEGGAHRFGGLGLGLAITRQLVAMHKGSISATSSGLGLGSTFSVEFPLHVGAEETLLAESSPAPIRRAATTSASRIEEQPQSSSESQLPYAPHPPLRRKLLLVEDHEATRQTLARLLSRRGYEVSSAGSLAEARQLASSQKFEMLVSDLGLPDGTGHALMGELQKIHSGSLRGIALSGYGMEEDINRSREAGFSEHLTKPVEFQALEQAIRRASV